MVISKLREIQDYLGDMFFLDSIKPANANN